VPQRPALRRRGQARVSRAARAAEDREFFLAFAQTWQQVQREQQLRQQLVVDGHAPAMYRAATVRNLDAWYTAFQVKPRQALYLAPKDRVRVW
jgi:putative endopeptidase